MDRFKKRVFSWRGMMLPMGCVLSIISAVGCNRSFYRRTADRDAYNIVAEKGAGPNWTVQGFRVEPDSRSRFYDPSCATDPTLPTPAPKLYGYSLPPLATEEAPPRDLKSDELGSESSEVLENRDAEQDASERAEDPTRLSQVVSLANPPSRTGVASPLATYN